MHLDEAYIDSFNQALLHKASHAFEDCSQGGIRGLPNRDTQPETAAGVRALCALGVPALVRMRRWLDVWIP